MTFELTNNWWLESEITPVLYWIGVILVLGGKCYLIVNRAGNY